ncbi:MAG TPA: enoyl-CoA hydratase family protein [Mycobacterium sp.]
MADDFSAPHARDLVQYAVDGSTARVTLDSPRNRNALSSMLVQQLHQGLRDAAANPKVRAVVLGHTGETFCAGADLSEAASAPETDRTRQMTDLLRAMLQLPLPVVGGIDGHVRAGAFGLVGACDIVVAGPNSTFALTEARIGVAPAIISLTLLPKITARAAGRYYLTGEKFGAEEAQRIGLVSVAADDVDATVGQITAELAKGSPQGLRESKALTTAAILDGYDERAEQFSAQSARLFGSDEAREGMLAFLQKRPPSWAPRLAPER